MVYAVVGKWRSKYRSGHALNRRLLKRASEQHSSTCVNRAKVSNGRGSAAGDAGDNADRRRRCGIEGC